LNPSPLPHVRGCFLKKGLLALAVLTAALAFAQTAPETEAYRKAQRDRETARRLIRDGTSQAAMRDLAGMDGTIDNSSKRAAGELMLQQGQALLATTEETIRSYEAKREQLRQLVQNKDRMLELESRDGRKAMFGIVAVDLPKLTVVRPDLSVFDLSHDQLSDASKAAVMTFLEPKLDITALPFHGGHVFPALLLSLPKTTSGQETEGSLPLFGVDLRVSPTAANLSTSTTLEVTAESSLPGMRLQTRRFDLDFAPGPAPAETTTPTDGSTPAATAPAAAPAGPLVISRRVSLDLSPDDLRRVGTGSEASLRLELAYGEKTTRELTLSLELHSVLDLPLAIREQSGTITDTSRILASCVDESLAEFESVRTFAKDEGILNDAGESTTSSDHTDAKLFAFWHQLATLGFQFTASTAGEDTTAKGYIARRIRLPSQILATKQVDTFELALLIASYAMKENLSPLLLFRPDQAVVAVRTTEQDYILIDPAGLATLQFPEGADKAAKLKASREAYDRSTGSARRAHLRTLSRMENAGSLRSQHPEGTTLESLATTFQVLDIKRARDAGVTKLLRLIESPAVEASAPASEGQAAAPNAADATPVEADAKPADAQAQPAGEPAPAPDASQQPATEPPPPPPSADPEPKP
jgi:hypothetical protein